MRIFQCTSHFAFSADGIHSVRYVPGHYAVPDKMPKAAADHGKQHGHGKYVRKKPAGAPETKTTGGRKSKAAKTKGD